MKFSVLSAVVALAFLGAPLQAASLKTASTYDQALVQLGQDGYVLMMVPDGWDKNSLKACKKLIKEDKVIRALGDSVLIRVNLPQVTTEEKKLELEKQLGKLKLPNVDSYPAFVLINKYGAHYATVCGKPLRRGDVDKVAAMLHQRVSAGREQVRLLARAEAASGVEKARLLGQAATIKDVLPPQKVVEQIQKLDPEDKTGFVRRLRFNPWGFAEQMNKKETEVAIDEIDSMLVDPAYTDEQKQMICATYVGILRRSGKRELLSQIPATVERMRAFAPDTMLARSGRLVLREWVRSFSLGDGWSPSTLPENSKPAQLGGVIPIHNPGEYTVTFRYTGGLAGLGITAVELYDGDVKVAEDRHDGFAGRISSDNIYNLNVKTSVVNPRLLITFKINGPLDSHGAILIQAH